MLRMFCVMFAILLAFAFEVRASGTTGRICYDVSQGCPVGDNSDLVPPLMTANTICLDSGCKSSRNLPDPVLVHGRRIEVMIPNDSVLSCHEARKDVVAVCANIVKLYWVRDGR
jgi:hypothetical protein